MIKIGLVGATNAGKSRLFNNLLGTHRAIVTDIPGTTRELLRDTVTRGSTTYELIDSPGLLDFSVEMQFVEQIVKEADILLFVVDGKQDLGTKEQTIHEMICRHDAFARTILVVNKLDGKIYHPDYEVRLSERYVRGYERVVGISAEQEEGIEQLMHEIFGYVKASQGRLPEKDPVGPKTKEPINLVIVGRPNAGKSTLINKLTNKEISFVSPTPGTTLDYLRASFDRKGIPMQLYDTAGIRKKGHTHGLERIAYEKTKSLIEYLHPIGVLMIDLVEGLTKRDATLLHEYVEIGGPIVVAVNKIDSFLSTDASMKIKQLTQAVKMPVRVPIVPISAKKGTGLAQLMQTVVRVHQSWTQRVDTPALNKVVTHAWLTRPPRFPKNKICKWKYITQIKVAPPTFMASVNDEGYANFSFQNRMEKVIREEFGFEGCPIKLEFREKTTENPYV